MIPEDAIWILELIRNRDARTEAEKDAVNAAIEALKAQLSQEGTTSDLISRQAAIDALNEYFSGIGKLKRRGLTKGEKAIGLDTVGAIKTLPSAQPEPTDINAKEAVYNLAEKIGIHQLFALTVELRGEPIHSEPQWIPVSERLPEDFTDVLVWFEYFRYGDYNCLYQTHGIGTYVANYNLWTVNHETGWKDLRVIAWMPLPEPYNPNK